MVLLTGASGFLGQHLARYLSAQGQIVRALYNSNTPNEDLLKLPGINWEKCDLLDIYAVEEAMVGISEIYHCAAIVSFDPRRKNEMLHFNVESTANIVNEALEQGIRKMVYVSSVAALGRLKDKKKEISEEEEWEEGRENSSYGMSKYLAEMEVWRGIAEGLNAVIINPGIILGEGKWDEGTAKLIKVAQEEFPFYTDGLNAWADVADVVRISHLLMQNEISGERFIVSVGNLPYKTIFTLMASALGKKAPHIHAGPLLSSLLWRFNSLKRFFTGKSASITKETARNAQNKCYYNNNKLLKVFPDFSYTPIEQTIQRISQQFLKESMFKK